jgi:hypothetical protein
VPQREPLTEQFRQRLLEVETCRLEQGEPFAIEGSYRAMLDDVPYFLER